jgi:hypothetical protein
LFPSLATCPPNLILDLCTQTIPDFFFCSNTIMVYYALIHSIK